MFFKKETNKQKTKTKKQYTKKIRNITGFLNIKKYEYNKFPQIFYIFKYSCQFPNDKYILIKFSVPLVYTRVKIGYLNI